jgi:hypothetical protein
MVSLRFSATTRHPLNPHIHPFVIRSKMTQYCSDTADVQTAVIHKRRYMGCDVPAEIAKFFTAFPKKRHGIGIVGIVGFANHKDRIINCKSQIVDIWIGPGEPIFSVPKSNDPR